MATSASLQWNVEPPSSSAICRADYSLSHKPTIVVVPIGVKSGAAYSSAVPVRSQKLRGKAIRELLTIQFKDYSQNYAIHFWAGKDKNGGGNAPVDHLLILPPADDKVDRILNAITVAAKSIKPLETEKLIRHSAGQLQREPLHVTLHEGKLVQPGRPFRPNDDDRDYWKKLDILTREFIRNAALGEATCNKSGDLLLELTTSRPSPRGFSRETVLNDPKDAPPDFDRALKELMSAQNDLTEMLSPVPHRTPQTPRIPGSSPVSTLSDLPTLDTAVNVADASKVSILMRIRPKLDPVQEKLRMELDLVPGIKAFTPLSELVLNVFGRTIRGAPGIHHHLKEIRGMLTGLEVSRNYKLPQSRSKTSVDNGELRAEDLSAGPFPIGASPSKYGKPSTPSSIRTSLSILDEDECDFIIRDVQLPGDVPRFIYKDQRHCSVTKYFKDIIGKDLQHPWLPLAQVGRDSWIPLEMLKVHRTQHLPTSLLDCGLLQDALKEETRAKSLSRDAGGKNRLMNKSADFKRFADQVMVSMFSGKNMQSFLDITDGVVVPTDFQDANKACDTSTIRRKHSAGAGLPMSMAVIYVEPKGAYKNDFEEFAKKVDNRVRERGQRTKDQEDAEKILDLEIHATQQRVAIISDVKPLLLPQCRDEPSIQAIRADSPTSIIAFVDERGRSKNEVRNFRAELYKFGNRKIGAVTYCTTRRTLEHLLNENDHIRNYFPLGVVWRLNAMHGHCNFHVDNSGPGSAVGSSPESAIIVVGAHIARPGPGASEYCPSVAAVVASTNRNMVLFPGSARVQSSIRLIEQSNGRLIHHKEPQILELEVMLHERLKAWKETHADLIPQIIYYRDGLDIVKHGVLDGKMKAVVDDEMAAIQKAAQAVLGDENLTITYVLVNKSSESASPYGHDISEDLKAHGFECFWRPDPKGHKGVLQYCVLRNVETQSGTGISINRLTEQINDNYQFDRSATPSIALPLHFAKKLALRTLDFFRFAVTNEYDTVSANLRLAKYPDHEGEKNAAAITNPIVNYLDISHDGEAAEKPKMSLETIARSTSRPSSKNPWHSALDKTMFYM